jgi:hypothetical protein
MVPPGVWEHYMAPDGRRLAICFTCWTTIVEARDGGRYQAEHGRPALLPNFIPIPRRGAEALVAMSPVERKAFYDSTVKDAGFRWVFDPEISAHVDRLHARDRADREAGPRWWWLSFVDPDRPDADKFLGAAIVWADTYENALRTARSRGCNPGGEVLGSAIPRDDIIEPRWQHRLLSRADVDEFRRSRWPAVSVGDADPPHDADHDLEG